MKSPPMMKFFDVAKILLAGGIAAIVIGAIITPLLSPVLTVVGNKLSAKIVPPLSPINIVACSPLKDSRIILSISTDKGSQVIADFPHHVPNDTFVYVENTSEKAFKEVYLTIYPLAFGKEDPELMSSQMWFTALHGSASYKPSLNQKSKLLELFIPNLNPGDAALIEQTFAMPVGFVVELYAEGYTLKKIFSPGCPTQIEAKEVFERASTPYVGKDCKLVEGDAEKRASPRTHCEYTDTSPITITNEMRGKELQVEERTDSDPLRVRVPVLRNTISK